MDDGVTREMDDGATREIDDGVTREMDDQAMREMDDRAARNRRSSGEKCTTVNTQCVMIMHINGVYNKSYCIIDRLTTTLRINSM